MLEVGSPLIQRSTDCAVNTLYVLSFLTMGDGGMEASKLLGLLGLPNSTTMEKRTFGTLENRIGPVLQELCQETLDENLDRAVLRSFNNDQAKFDDWKQNRLPQDEFPRVPSATDMAWQKRSSGRNCCSLSGHGFFVDCLTRKPIAMCVKAKNCRRCTFWRKKNGDNTPPPAHKCVVNHVGSSGSMEPSAVLDMCVHSFNNKRVNTNLIVTDDDSTIKAKLKHSNADHMAKHNLTRAPTTINSNGNVVPRPDHGRLPINFPEPLFAADPSHRKKTLKGDLYRLVAKKKAVKKTMMKCDCIRVSTNFAHMSRTLPGTDTATWVNKGKAVLEHHFDCHTFCGDFCRRKASTEDKRKASDKFCRSKEKDRELHELLEELIARFVTADALEEVGHGFDTLVNESLNQTM